MLDAKIEQPHTRVAMDAELRPQLRALHAENERLRAENRQLRATLASYVTRARSTAMYGPVEMTAGTCVGPRQRSRERPEPSHLR